jgi:hypothetical protein
MRSLAGVVLAFACMHACAADSWLNPLPNSLFSTPSVAIARERYVEIPVSMLAKAEEELAQVSALQLAPYGPENYRRPEFSCPLGTMPYLVRAMFMNGSTGGYHLERRAAALVVIHSSLGRATGHHRSALLTCLDFVPAEVYVGLAGGM